LLKIFSPFFNNISWIFKDCRKFFLTRWPSFIDLQRSFKIFSPSINILLGFSKIFGNHLTIFLGSSKIVGNHLTVFRPSLMDLKRTSTIFSPSFDHLSWIFKDCRKSLLHHLNICLGSSKIVGNYLIIFRSSFEFLWKLIKENF